MNCPVCDKPMIVFEIDQVEVDHCVGCGGTWLDAGELELLLEGTENKDQLLSALAEDTPAGEAMRICPICEKKMCKVAYGCGDSDPVILDKCKKNDGLWFDGGELREIIKMGNFPCENKVFQLLNDVFRGDS